MINLYKYREFLEILNIAIIISIPILCLFLYKISKDTYFFTIAFIYVVEFIFLLVVMKYMYEDGISEKTLTLMMLIYITKAMLFFIFRKKLKVEMYINFTIVMVVVLNVWVIMASYEISVLVNILLDLIIVNLYVTDKIKKANKELKKNRHKLKINKKYISKAINEINQQYQIQNQMKNEILNLNDKVERSIEGVSTPIFVLNINKEFIYSNDAFRQTLQDENFDMDKFDVSDYLKDKFANSYEAMDIIKKINVEGYKSLNLTTYDEKIYRFVCATDIINNQGIILCILNDITQSTIIQNKLKESEERYKKLMDILSDGVIIHNMDTISYINNKGMELFNLDTKINKILLMSDIKSKVSKNSKQEFLKNINLVHLNKKEKSISTIETEDGKIIEFITTSLTLNDTKMMLSIAVDVTTLENAMDDLEQSEKTYKLLLQTLPEGIVIINKKTKDYTYRNKAMIKILKNIGVEKLNELVNIYIKEKTYGKFKKFTVSGPEKIDISIAIIDLKEDGNLLLVVRILDDEYKVEKMAQQLSKINDNYKFKTEFLSDVTKDLKKPINTIFTVNSILDINKEKYNSQSVNNYTRLVKQNCYRLIRLLNNVEEIGKIENGNYNINVQKYDIIEVIRNISKKVNSYAQERGLKLIFNSNVNEKVLMIDKEKIEKIILNLLSNSIKFTDPGGEINLSVNENEKEVRICVKDTGIGIPNDKIDVIFENFEQVDRTLSRGAEGTGIGLSIVKKIAHVHKAKIIVQSKPNVGSQFELVLNKNVEYENVYEDIDLNNSFSDDEKIEIEFSDIYLS